MASVKFQRKEFEKSIKITKEIEEKISMFGTHLESLTPEEVEIEVFANRPDVLSLQGFLRAFKAFIGKETGLKEYKIRPPEKSYKVAVDSSLAQIRPYTACAIVKKLTFNDASIKEMIDLQEKLHTTLGRNRKKVAIGIYPLEKITLPIKFEARSPANIRFQPLESEREMSGSEILQRHPTGRDYAHLLANAQAYPVFVDAKGKILSMPPIINSHETGRITKSTKEVFIECSGSDLSVLKRTLNIIVTSLADLGGDIYAMELQYKNEKIVTPDLKPEKMKISLENTNKLLGLSLKDKDLEKLLPRMGYEYSKGTVTIPAWRTDILHEVDLIEDIAIAYGYDKLIPAIPQIATISSESADSVLKDKIASLLVGLGMIELSSLHLVRTDELVKSKLMPQQHLELENSKTDYKFLRPNLLIPALRMYANNKDNEYPQKVFELGTVFNPDTGKETGISEYESLFLGASPANFTDLKQIIDYLMRSLGITYEMRELVREGLIDGRTASIIVKGKEIGYIGEVHPETLHAWNIKLPLTVAELSATELYKALKN